jgi:opacity protein-like surface antigen
MKTSKQQILNSLTALSLLAPLASVAHATMFENGFFVGAKIGGQQAMATYDQNASLVVSDFGAGVLLGQSTGAQDGHAFHTNLMGNVSAGYAHIVNQFFLAAEVSINVAEEQEFSWRENEAAIGFNGDFLIDSLVTDTSVEIENPDVILDLRPGILLAKNFLFYGRLGVAFNEISLEQTAATTFTDDVGNVEHLSASDSTEDNVAGLRVGLGLEYKLTRNLGLVMDYVFTDYGTITNTLNQTMVSTKKEFLAQAAANPFNSQAIVNSEVHVYKNTGTVGVNWYFGGKKHHKPVMMDK